MPWPGGIDPATKKKGREIQSILRRMLGGNGGFRPNQFNSGFELRWSFGAFSMFSPLISQ